jgi:hypothetical protein
MANLLNLLQQLSSTPGVQTTANGVSGITRQVFAPSNPAPSAVPGQFQKQGGPNDLSTLTPPPQSRIPIVVQTQVANIAASSVQQALQKQVPGVGLPTIYTAGGVVSAAAKKLVAGDFSPSAAAELIDVAAAPFKNGVSIDAFQLASPALRQAALRAGIPPSAVTTIINTTASVIDSGLKTTIDAAQSKFGTSKLNPANYAEFSRDVVSNVQVGLVTGGLDSRQFTSTVLQALPPLPTSTNISRAPADQTPAPPLPVAAPAEPHQMKVMLRGSAPQQGLNRPPEVTFLHQPKISASDKADYSSMDPIHMPGGFRSYKGNPARQYSVSDIKLFSRTREEATENLRILNLLKSWVKPSFGQALQRDTDPPEPFNPIAENANPRATVDFPVVPREIEYGKAVEDIVTNLNGNDQGFARYITSTNPAAGVPPTLPQLFSSALSNPATVPAELVNRARIEILAAGRGKSAKGARREIARRAAEEIPTERPAVTAPPRQQSNAPTSQVTAATVSDIPATNPVGEVYPSSGTTDVRRLGSPPEVLYFYAYSQGDGISTGPTTASAQNIFRVPVAIESISYEYPNEIDYIPTTTGIPFPAVMTLQINLIEMRSPKEMEQFSLSDYRRGVLVGW